MIYFLQYAVADDDYGPYTDDEAGYFTDKDEATLFAAAQTESENRGRYEKYIGGVTEANEKYQAKFEEDKRLYTLLVENNMSTKTAFQFGRPTVAPFFKAMPFDAWVRGYGTKYEVVSLEAHKEN